MINANNIVRYFCYAILLFATTLPIRSRECTYYPMIEMIQGTINQAYTQALAHAKRKAEKSALTEAQQTLMKQLKSASLTESDRTNLNNYLTALSKGAYGLPRLSSEAQKLVKPIKDFQSRLGSQWQTFILWVQEQIRSL